MNSRGVLFARDVTLARYAAALGFLVGFLEGAIETWNEWGRSI
jgi:dolichol-phosphate mannosyltransferase